jgi:N-acetylglucosamine repressor
MMKVSMSEPRRGNRDLIKAMNRNLVLNTIRTQGPLSRTQLTEVTGLSVGAVSQITNDLLASDWILAVGEGDYTGGRRQMMLRLNPTKGHVIGLKLTESQVFCALTDLETKVMKYIEQPLNCEHTPEAISDVIGDVVKRAIFEADVARSQILGVGIGLAGIVDNQLGIVRYSPFFHWRNIPLAKLVGDRLSLPVYVENDVNTLTITEQLFGPGRTVENFAVVTVGRGVGMGMVLNHRLYQGGAGGTGEIGHITLDPNGPQCDCGKRGCLESLAADPAVISYVEQQLATGVDSIMVSPLELSDIIQAADEDDQLARHALARSGRYLGMGLSVVVNMLTPTLIIVSGEGIVAGDYRLQSMFEALSEHSFGNLLENIEIVIEPTNDQSWARGAAGFVVGKLFESPLISAHQPEAAG